MADNVVAREPAPGDVCSVMGISTITDPLNIILSVGGSIMLDMHQRIPRLVLASAGSINVVGTFDSSRMLWLADHGNAVWRADVLVDAP